MLLPSHVRKRRGAARCVLALGLLLSPGAGATTPPQEPSPGAGPATTPEALETLNNASRMMYTQAKAAAMARQGPVMIVVGDDLVLRKGNDRKQARVVPDLYHTLKSYSHVALAIDIALAAHADDAPLPDSTLDDLRDYLALFPAAAEAIPAAGLTPEQQARQRAILDGSRSFLQAVLERRRCSRDERIAYTRRMTPKVMANASDAARAALDLLHRQVLRWKSELSPEEWQRLKVLVIGRQLPRRDNLAVQYFARLLGEPGEGGRIVYAEGLGDEPRAMDLLATRVVDAQIAIDFFNDPMRMFRDLLSDGARDYLPLLLDHPHEP